jgi:hypothetical protein
MSFAAVAFAAAAAVLLTFAHWYDDKSKENN